MRRFGRWRLLRPFSPPLSSTRPCRTVNLCRLRRNRSAAVATFVRDLVKKARSSCLCQFDRTFHSSNLHPHLHYRYLSFHGSTASCGPFHSPIARTNGSGALRSGGAEGPVRFLSMEICCPHRGEGEGGVGRTPTATIVIAGAMGVADRQRARNIIVKKQHITGGRGRGGPGEGEREKKKRIKERCLAWYHHAARNACACAGPGQATGGKYIDALLVMHWLFDNSMGLIFAICLRWVAWGGPFFLLAVFCRRTKRGKEGGRLDHFCCWA